MPKNKGGNLYMDEFLILLQAKLDEAKSKGNVNADIKELQNQLDKLKVQVDIDPKSIANITQQMSKLGIQVGQDFGKAFNNGLQSTLNTNVLNQINKISDSSTSTIVQNEKKKQEAYKATSDAVVYHAGVISKLNKAETNGRFYGSNRGTGYFGTGHYFVDSKTKHELDNNSSYSKLPYTSVDISKYDNLFKANTDEIANKLHGFLENLTKFTQGSNRFNIDELFSQFKNVFTDTTMDIKSFGDKLEQLKAFMSNSNLSDRSDSVSTQFMKSLGYGGVDTRGTKYADTRYGTVIYDLKEESVLQANITDELQKQGQMLEKINYQKGQVFDSSIDVKIQEQINAQRQLAEIKAEFNKIFDSTNLNRSESELTSAQNRLTEINTIISDCQRSIQNATAESQQFAKQMKSIGINMTDAEIAEHAKESSLSYKQRIEELSLERTELEKRLPLLEENYNKELRFSQEAGKRAQEIVEQRRLAEQQSSVAANEVIQNEEKKQQAIQDTLKIQEQLTKNGNIIQQTDFATSFYTKDEAEKYFNTLAKIVSIQGKLGENKNLESFIVEVKNAEGVVEKLTYKYNELNSAFEYSGGSINNNGVQKQIDTINMKASRLQDTFESLKSKYSDLNSSNPIKEQSHISELENQYRKVEQAIAAVKSSDSATISSMISNAESEIKALQRMGEEFKRAETISMRMNGSDISSGFAQAQERLQKLKANSVGFEQMTETIQKLDAAIATVGDKSSLKAFIDQLKVAESQLDRVKAEIKSMSQVNKIQLSMDNGTYESKVDALVAKTRQWTDANGNARISTNELSKAFNQLTTASNNYTNSPTEAHQKALIASEKELDNQIKIVTNSVRSMNAELAKDSAITSFRNQVADFMGKNGKTVKSFQFGSELKDIFAQIQQGAKLSNQELSVLKQRFIDVQNSARAAGKLGKTFFQTIREGMSSFSYWTSSTFLVMKTIQSIKGGIRSVVELDTALVDLRKTTSMTYGELEKFYYEANTVAKQMGVTTAEIINQASAWSRLGYSSAEAASKMAKYSSMFASISPGMNVDTATDGLVSVMKAFDIGNDNPDDVLDGIMSKINIIGNTAATSNAEIVNMLTRSSSAMKEANNTLEETIALETAAVEITRDDASVGTAFKTVAMRIRGRQTLPPYTVMYMLCA